MKFIHFVFFHFQPFFCTFPLLVLCSGIIYCFCIGIRNIGLAQQINVWPYLHYYYYYYNFVEVLLFLRLDFAQTHNSKLYKMQTTEFKATETKKSHIKWNANTNTISTTLLTIYYNIAVKFDVIWTISIN